MASPVHVHDVASAVDIADSAGKSIDASTMSCRAWRILKALQRSQRASMSVMMRFNTVLVFGCLRILSVPILQGFDGVGLAEDCRLGLDNYVAGCSLLEPLDVCVRDFCSGFVATAAMV